jgi:hypothetical protein
MMYEEEDGPSVPLYSIAPLFVNPVGVKISCARRSPESGSFDSTKVKNLARKALVDSGKVGEGHCVLMSPFLVMKVVFKLLGRYLDSEKVL